MMLQPPQDLFETVFPREVSYDEMNTTWYPRVLEVHPANPVPDSVMMAPTYEALRIFLDHAERASMPVEFNRQAVDWSRVEAEIRGELPMEAAAGDYIYGLNSGAKGSLDQTYLRQAEMSGLLDLRPLHWVQRIAQDPDGYRVEVNVIDEEGMVLEQVVFLAEQLILAAGTLGTSRLLVEAKGRGDMPGLSATIGEGFAQNGQHIVQRGMLMENTGALQGGPPCAVIHDRDNGIAPVTVEYGAAPFGFESHTLICPSSSMIEGTGRIFYDPMEDRGMLSFPESLGQLGVRAGEATVQRLCTAAGGMLQPLIGRTRPTTFHPLGGVVMGLNADSYGRVNGMPGLYALDGSLIPGVTPLCNPAWTIAAIAERAMATLITTDFAPAR
jgi:cholesterol oxidase